MGKVAAERRPSGLICGSHELRQTVPTEFQVFKTGTWKGFSRIDPVTNKETIEAFSITPADLTACEQYMQSRKQRAPHRDLVVDYQHATVYGAKGEAPAAGWIGNLQRRGTDELWATDVTFTEKAAAHILADEYRYISPVFRFGARDKATGEIIPLAVYHASLTNEPFFDELLPVMTADDTAVSGERQRFYLFTGADITEAPYSSPSTKATTMEELLERLRYFLNLPLTATIEEILAEMQKLSDQIKTATTTGAAGEMAASHVPALLTFATGLKTKAATFAAEHGAIVGIMGLPADTGMEGLKAHLLTAHDASARIVVLAEENTRLKDTILAADFGAVLETAARDGRATPAQIANEQWKGQQMRWAREDFAGFKKYFTAEAPVLTAVVPIKPDNPGGAVDDGADVGRRAQEYMAEQALKGITISASDAVKHVTSR